MSTVPAAPTSGDRKGRGWEAMAAPVCAMRKVGLLSCLLLSFLLISTARAEVQSSVSHQKSGYTAFPPASVREAPKVYLTLPESAATDSKEQDDRAYNTAALLQLGKQLQALKEDEDAHAKVLESLMKSRLKETKKSAAIAGAVGGAGLVGSALSLLGAWSLDKKAPSFPSSSEKSGWPSRGTLSKTLAGGSALAALIATMGFISAIRYGWEARNQKKDISKTMRNFREGIARRRQEMERVKLGKVPDEIPLSDAELAAWTP